MISAKEARSLMNTNEIYAEKIALLEDKIKLAASEGYHSITTIIELKAVRNRIIDELEYLGYRIDRCYDEQHIKVSF